MARKKTTANDLQNTAEVNEKLTTEEVTEAAAVEETAAEEKAAEETPVEEAAVEEKAAEEAAVEEAAVEEAAAEETAAEEKAAEEAAAEEAAVEEAAPEKKAVEKTKKPAIPKPLRKRKHHSETEGEKAGEAAPAPRKRFRKSADKMSEDLENLMEDDIKEMHHKEKTRQAEIMGIFAKHNFFMNGLSPVELRTTLEDLGPTYVKIGQIMSSRVDMFPEEYCKELGKLRENVKPLDSDVARAAIESELGKKIDEIFSDFNDEPLGSASIGQAHSATLLDGTKVVIKVQRPLIADMMRKDFVMLKKIASAFSSIHGGDEEDQALDLVSVIEELEKVTEEELDFRIEATNTINFKEECIEDETVISCPTIFPEMTTERIMTMTYVDGCSVGKRDRIIEDGYDPNEIGSVILDNYMHQVLDVGTFHADPHQGNIMVSHGTPYWIDFGMIGHLTNQNMKCIQDIILALINTDTEDMVSAVMAMGAASPKTDRSRLVEDMDALINRYMSVTNLEELDIAALLEDVSALMSSNHISIPSEYTILVRSITAMEGVIEELAPELNLFTQITKKVLENVKANFDLQQAVIGVGKDALSLGKKASRIPGLAADTLTGLNKGRVKIKLEPTGYEPILNEVHNSVNAIILAAFACVIFFGSCLLCMTDLQPQTPDGMPIVAVFGFIFSVALGIYALKKQKKKK